MYCPRECNRAAHELAKIGDSLGPLSHFVWLEGFPDVVCNLVLASDSAGLLFNGVVFFFFKKKKKSAKHIMKMKIVRTPYQSCELQWSGPRCRKTMRQTQNPGSKSNARRNRRRRSTGIGRAVDRRTLPLRRKSRCSGASARPKPGAAAALRSPSRSTAARARRRRRVGEIVTAPHIEGERWASMGLEGLGTGSFYSGPTRDETRSRKGVSL